MSTVLIVDYMQTDRDLLGKVVLASGNQPAYATNGEEALRKAAEVKPALILLDVVMPGLDGFSACRQLKRNAETAAIPVVLISLIATFPREFAELLLRMLAKRPDNRLDSYEHLAAELRGVYDLLKAREQSARGPDSRRSAPLLARV